MTEKESIDIIGLVITVVSTLIASSGFWMYMIKRIERKDLRSKLLLGLAHDRIIYLCLKYLNQGYITQDEFENLHDYLYCSYFEMGGNGTATKLMDDVKRLPIRPTRPRDTGELKANDSK